MMRRRKKQGQKEPGVVVIDSSSGRPVIRVVSALSKPLPTRDARLLVIASLLNEVEGMPTGIPSQAHDWARLVTGKPVS